jgi:hypothetical protein
MAYMDFPKKLPTSFPPMGYESIHKVQTGDNWMNLASRYYRADPLDIIIFNFETTKPREINWCLNEYVGCETDTPDGKNFRFSSADVPGYVYIPPKSWKPGGPPAKPSVPGESPTARAWVLQTLTHWALYKAQFTYSGRSITVGSYVGVANSIIDNQIRVAVDFSLDHAEYDHLQDALFLPWETAASNTRKALIVHEVIHAILDKAKSGFMVYQSETAAYLAQMMFMLEASGSGLTDSSGDSEQVYFVAYTIAKELAKGKKMTELSLEISALETAVQQHTLYKKKAFKAGGFNGI